jgi:hypothetical protein
MSSTIVIVDPTPEGYDLGDAMERAIQSSEFSTLPATEKKIKVITTEQLRDRVDDESVYCPLTLDLPPDFHFWGSDITRSCRDIGTLRHLAASITGVKSLDRGRLWLPIIWTVRGPIYGEAIAPGDPHYQQPIHLEDSQRQPLYLFAYQLLTHLQAPAATYLLQFGFEATEMRFDRLFPFPAQPALASVGIQTPDLFTCHWRCITRQPILDVFIQG